MTTSTSTTTEKPREVLITDAEAEVQALLYVYAAGEIPANMPDVFETNITGGSGWEGFMPFYEAAKSGQDAAVVIVRGGYADESARELTYLSVKGGTLYYCQGMKTKEGFSSERSGSYTCIMYTESEMERVFWLSDNADYTYKELR
jgi:hypothetical protein